MDTGPKIAQVAALVGDPARANMLSALMDGRTLTASELAYVSGVAPQTASGHLAKLSDAGLLALEKQGRRRYFRLASPLVARMMEGLMVVAQEGPARQCNLWRGGETVGHSSMRPASIFASPPSAACFAAPVSTGASAGRIWPGRSARPFFVTLSS